MSIIRPSDATVRVEIASESSDGIPIATEDPNDDTFTPWPARVSELTRKMADLTLAETFAILDGMARAAAVAGVDVEIDPMPMHEPTGVHLWSDNHLALCRWLQRERHRHFVSIPLEQLVYPEKEEAARFLLVSLSMSLPMARVVSVGPRRFIHWAWRR